MTETDLPGPVTAKNAALLEMCLREAALAGKPLMERLVSSAQQVAGRPSVDATRRERLSHSMGLLRSLAVGLGERFPAHLNRAFSAKSKPVPAAAGLASLRFDQLELMNESQVEEKMELARALSSISTEVDPKQKQLNALMSTVQGYKSIQPERNPLRPESYLDALVELFKQSEVGPDVRVDWLQCMGPDLGRALNDEYTRWITVLKTGGVKGASYALASGSAREGAAAGASGGQSRHSEGLDPTPYADARLTVKQLRRLVMGEFDMRREALGESPLHEGKCTLRGCIAIVRGGQRALRHLHAVVRIRDLQTNGALNLTTSEFGFLTKGQCLLASGTIATAAEQIPGGDEMGHGDVAVSAQAILIALNAVAGR